MHCLQSIISPMQLYHVGRDNAELSSQSEDESQQPSIGQDTISTLVSRAAEAVEVSNLHFCPCTNVKSDIDLLSQQSSQSNGYDVYRRVALLLGQHLRNHCTGCVYN